MKSIALALMFFGTLAIVGGIALASSGRIDPHNPAQLLRPLADLAFGFLNFIIGNIMMRKSPR